MRAWLGLAICSCLLGTPAGAADEVHAALDAIDILAAKAAHDEKLPGLQIAVIHGGELLWQHSYGMADIEAAEPVADTTRFRLGSMTKLFTAIAIVQLRDAGKLDLDDPVTRSLPWFRLKDEPHPTVTIRELLLHLAGLPREAIGASWAERTMPSRDALIASMPAEPHAIAPEGRWKYSNLGFAVLGLVIEAVSGESYADYVTHHLIEKLGLTETAVEPPAATADIAAGYGALLKAGRTKRDYLAMGGLVPAAGIVSTAGDMAHLAQFLMGDGDDAVLSERSRREMLRVQAIRPDWVDAEGLGFEIRRVGAATRIGHAGRAGGYAGRMEFDPVSKIGIAVLINADTGGPTKLIDQAMAILAPAIAAATPPPPPAVADPAWAKYTGTYRSEDGISEIAIADGHLVWRDPSAPDPAKTAILLDPVQPDTFRFRSGGLAGEDLVFDADAAGKITGMRAGGEDDLKQ